MYIKILYYNGRRHVFQASWQFHFITYKKTRLSKLRYYTQTRLNKLILLFLLLLLLRVTST
ncbi:unnamed protein product [Brassica oleracea var. botrytis]